MDKIYKTAAYDAAADALMAGVGKASAILGAPSSKASAILAGAGNYQAPDAFVVSNESETPFLNALYEARRGNSEALGYLKSLGPVHGAKAVTGSYASPLSIVPNNFVAGVAAQASLANPWRNILNVVTGVTGAGVDIPFEQTAISAALAQGAYASNKDNRDFVLSESTATLYTLAQIVDLGAQLLRQSNGAAETVARRRLGRSIGMAEAAWVTNGTGSGQPMGILPALLAFGDVAAFKTTLSSEPRAATIGRAIGALQARGHTPSAVVLHPTTAWTTVTEGLGTSYAGGWAIEPGAGPSGSAPQQSFWGVPMFVDSGLPTGTGLVVAGNEMDLFYGQTLTIDVSTEAGGRWDANLVGYRAELEVGFHATPYVATGMVQKILGL